MGRRIYIHKDAFRNLIERESAAADMLVDALLRTKAAKMLYRHIVEDGPALGVVDAKTACAVADKVARGFGPTMTHALRRLGYRSPMPQLRKDIDVVLAADEQVVASCYDDGYFTFATSDDAASVMYEDKEKMSELRRRIRVGRCDDLTLIGGRNLVLIRPDVGIGTGKAASYSDIFARKARYPAGQLHLLQRALSGRLGAELLQLFPIDPGANNRGYLSSQLELIGEALQEPLFN